MVSASMLVLCASALFFETIYAQYLRAPAARPGCAAPAYPNPMAPCSAAGYGYGNIVSTQAASGTGGGLSVTSSSPFAPDGVYVLSDNDISGSLGASGNLPVLAAVALNGAVDTSGSAGTTYNCGNGQVGITAQSIAAAGLSVPGNSPRASPACASPAIASCGNCGGYGAATATNAAAAAASNAPACGAFSPRAFAPCGRF